MDYTTSMKIYFYTLENTLSGRNVQKVNVHFESRLVMVLLILHV